MTEEFTVKSYMAKVYDLVPTSREVTLIAKHDWPEDFYPGRVVSIEIQASHGDETQHAVHLLGKVTENDGTALRMEAWLTGERPIRVWSLQPGGIW